MPHASLFFGEGRSIELSSLGNTTSTCLGLTFFVFSICFIYLLFSFCKNSILYELGGITRAVQSPLTLLRA